MVMSTLIRKRTSKPSHEGGGSPVSRTDEECVRSRILKNRPRAVTWSGLVALVVLMLKVNLLFQAQLLLNSFVHKAEQNGELDNSFVPDTRPYFILHVGPPRTATTTLQATSMLYKEELAKDDYVFVGRADGFENTTKFKQLVSQECVLEVQEIGEVAPCWQELKQEIDQYATNQKHLIFSDEGYRHRFLGVSQDSVFAKMVRVLSEPFHTKLHQAADRDMLFWQLFRTAITERFQVQLHLTYRRYSEWLVSLKAREDLETVHNHQDEPLDYIVKHKEENPYNDIWAQAHLYRMLHGGFYSQYVHTGKSLALWERWLQQSLPQSHGSISMNYHAQDPPMIVQYFCHVLPTANTACLRAQQDVLANNNTIRRDQVSKITFVEGIVYHAARRGLLSDSTSTTHNDTALYEVLGTGNPQNRTALYEYLRHHIHDKLNLTHLDLPLICPSEKQLSNVLEESIRIETKLLPRIAFAAENNMTEKSQRREFWHQVKQDKLWCTVDVERLVRGKQNWAQVFQGLEKIAAAKQQKQQQLLSSGSTSITNNEPPVFQVYTGGVA